MSPKITYLAFSRQQGLIPGSVVAIAERPQNRPELQCCTQVKLPFKARGNGLPEDAEIERLDKLEAQLIEVLSPLGALHLGHIASNGFMIVAFQAPANMPKTVKVKTGLLSRETLELVTVRDPDWGFYDEKLAPSELDATESRNRKLLGHLASMGDKAEIARSVEFTANFPTADARTNFLATVGPMTYRPGPKGTWETLDGPNKFWCQVVTATDLSPVTMAHRCVYLSKEAREAGGEFDGWSSPAIKA